MAGRRPVRRIVAKLKDDPNDKGTELCSVWQSEKFPQGANLGKLSGNEQYPWRDPNITIGEVFDKYWLNEWTVDQGGDE